jgi:hypothetical protein
MMICQEEGLYYLAPLSLLLPVFDDKRPVVDLMITTIAATNDSLNITWKI